MEMGVANVAAITTLVYIAGLGFKATRLGHKWVPVLCGTLGILLGILGLYLNIPDFPASDPLTAAAVGGVSGLAATGLDQAFKQLHKDN